MAFLNLCVEPASDQTFGKLEYYHVLLDDAAGRGWQGGYSAVSLDEIGKSKSSFSAWTFASSVDLLL